MRRVWLRGVLLLGRVDFYLLSFENGLIIFDWGHSLKFVCEPEEIGEMEQFLILLVALEGFDLIMIVGLEHAGKATILHEGDGYVD